jgi:hypothetical protein
MALININWSECPMKKDAEVLRYMRERAPWYQSGTSRRTSWHEREDCSQV